MSAEDFERGRAHERELVLHFLKDVVPLYSKAAMESMPKELLAGVRPMDMAAVMVLAILADAVGAIAGNEHEVRLTAKGQAFAKGLKQ